MKSIFFQKTQTKKCDSLRLIIREKQVGNDTNVFEKDMFPILDKLLEYKFITPKQHKQILNKFNLLHTKRRTKTI